MLRRQRPRKPVESWKGPKPKLPMQITYLCRVHYLDLQAYLAKVYRMEDYDILRATGVVSGVHPEFLVTGRLPPAGNINQQVDNIRRGRKTRSLDLILNVLCADGFIPKGKYVINTMQLPDPVYVYTQLLNKHQDPDHGDCVAFRNGQEDPDFQRRAKVLDKLTREHKQEQDNERT